MASCVRCSKVEEKLRTDRCIACERDVCRDCQGDAKNYTTLEDHEGHACRDCLKKGDAFSQDLMAPMRTLVPRLKQDVGPSLIKLAMDRVQRLTETTLGSATTTVTGSVVKLEVAIDKVRESATQLQASLRTTLIWVAIIVGVVNFGSILVAVVVARAMR